METTNCNECGCLYNFENNNTYGYLNCCFSCGENKYQDRIPQLNFDVISKILNIRMETKKDDRYKNNFNAVQKNLHNMFNKNPNNKDGDFQLADSGKVFVGLSEATYFYFDYIMHENYILRQKKDKEFFERIRQR